MKKQIKMSQSDAIEVLTSGKTLIVDGVSRVCNADNTIPLVEDVAKVGKLNVNPSASVTDYKEFKNFIKEYNDRYEICIYCEITATLGNIFNLFVIPTDFKDGIKSALQSNSSLDYPYFSFPVGDNKNGALNGMATLCYNPNSPNYFELFGTVANAPNIIYVSLTIYK